MRKITFLLLFMFTVALAGAQTVFINEFHYDNTGGDSDEAFEVAGPAGTDLAGWMIVKYNGSNGETYGTDTALSGVLLDEMNGYGAFAFASDAIQNGDPDGFALVDAGGTVVQFLSYEGSFTATNGPAAGMTSEDIGVFEPGSTPVGQSLQLTGTGTEYGDFAWQAPALSSFDVINNGQTFMLPPPPPAGQECVDAVTTLDGAPGTVTNITLAITGGGTIGAGMTDMLTLDNALLEGLLYNQVQELTVTLASPAGTTITLFSNDGGNSANAVARDLVFTDASANDVDDWDGAGSFQADFMAEGGSLNDTFEGEEINGDWILTVTNGGANGGGTLDNFCLTFTENGTVGTVPTIECPMPITVDNDEDACGAIVNYADAIAIDDEDGALDVTQVAGTPVSGDEFPVGVTTVTFEATDSNGNTVMCSFDVTVNDVSDPTIECVADILVANDPGACEAFVTVENPTITDNCEASQPGTITNDYPDATAIDDASGIYPVGTTTVEFTYTDAGGNTATCTVDVTVEDTEAPVIACEGSIDDTVTETAAPGAVLEDGAGNEVTSVITITESQIITDANLDININHTWVSDLDITLTSPAGTSVLVYDGGADGCGSDDIVVLFDDESANALSTGCQGGLFDQAYTEADYMPSNALSAFDGEDTAGDWTLEVVDNVGGDDGVLNTWGLNLMYEATPLPPLEVILDEDGLATLDASDLLLSATDNCDTDPMISVGALEACGQTNASNAFENGSDVELGGANTFATANDLVVADGQNFNLNQVVANLFHTPGSPIETANFNYFEDDAGLPGAMIGSQNDVAPTSQEVVGNNFGFDVSTTTFDLDTFTFEGQEGAETTYWIEIEVASNPAGRVFWEVTTATIAGNPTASSPDDGTTWELFDPAVPTDGVYEFNGFCDASANEITFTCEEVGENTIEVTATDAAGNSSTCDAIVNVVDNTDPIVVCQDFTLELEDDGTATLDPLSLIDMENSVEACGFDLVTADITEFDCSNIGTDTMVTVFVQDPSGNIASCSAMVTVVDVNGPVLTCPEDQVRPADEDTFQYIMEDFTGMATATDGCSTDVTLAQDPAVGTSLGVNTDGYTVTITATDDLGNESTCTFNLQVLPPDLGVDDNELSNAISMYPNPATEIVNLSNTSNIALDRAAIYDVNGKLVSDVDLDGMIGERAIDVSTLATGVYIVQISGEGATIAKRLIIE